MCDWVDKFSKKFKNGKFCRGCNQPMLSPYIHAGEFASLFNGKFTAPIDSNNLLFVVCQLCGFCDTYNLDLLQTKTDQSNS